MTEEFKILLEYYKVHHNVTLLEKPSFTGDSYPGYLDMVDANMESAKELLWRGKHVDDITLHNNSLKLFRITEKEIVYDSWVTRDPLIACTYTYVLEKGGMKMRGVWRQDRFPYLARELFFNYYLPKYDFIESDKSHSRDGRHFWHALLYKAKILNKQMTVLDRETSNEVDVDLLPEPEHNEVYGKDSNMVFRIYR